MSVLTLPRRAAARAAAGTAPDLTAVQPPGPLVPLEPGRLPFLALPRVDLLPPEVRERRALTRVKLGLAGAGVGAVGVVALLTVLASGSVHDAQDSLDASVSTQAALQADVGRYADVTATYARADRATGVLERAMGSEVRWSRLLDTLSRSVPPDVWLKSVTLTQTPAPAAGAPGAAAVDPATAPVGTAAFTGVGFSHGDVSLWLESLARQKAYADPTFQTSTASLVGTRRVVTFTSSASVTPDALSGRYRSRKGG